MSTLFTACVLFGGTLLVCQTLMTLLGLTGDHEFSGDHPVDLSHEGGSVEHGDDAGHADHHHSSTWFFGIVTFRTLVAAITFFGLGGMTSLSNDVAEGPSVVIGLLSGLAAMYSVHWLMRQISRLRADGSVRIERAVGMTGGVYLRVPGAHQGAGKIQLNLQNRTVELTAWTDQSELPTGSTVVVTRVIGPDSVEVVSTSA